MADEQSGVQVYRDNDGNLCPRVPDEQKAAAEPALAEQDTAGYLGSALTNQGIIVIGGLTRVGLISQLSNSLTTRGIIIVGGRQI
jgi:hypothetical protein